MANTRSLSNATALRDENVLRRVRHLGSAHDGLQEWRLQRRTALALIPLGLYFAASMLRLATSDQTTAAAWLASPVPALLTILFVLALLAHAVVGCARSSSITCTPAPAWLAPSYWCAVLQ
jgi:succinate dehydrogenase / fumarate reductase membrane anchor subunit